MYGPLSELEDRVLRALPFSPGWWDVSAMSGHLGFYVGDLLRSLNQKHRCLHIGESWQRTV